MKLVPGEVAVRQGSRNTRICAIKSGLVRVEENTAVALVVVDDAS
jgi:F0F1-type ATP synthase epsilon subunit